MHHPLLTILVAAIALAAGGCQKAADAATEAAIERASGQKVSVDRRGDAMHISTPEGELKIATGEGIALPTDFPDDVFLPSTYGVVSVMDISGARLVNLNSDGSVASMFEAARSGMADRGWTQTLAIQQADSAMLGFARDDRETTYTFTRHGGGEQLAVSIQLRDSATQQ